MTEAIAAGTRIRLVYLISASLTSLLFAPAIARSEAATKSEAQSKEESPAPFDGLKLRALGPAFPSGRVSDFAVHPGRSHRYFAAIASGGLWLTEDNGNTWKPVFDSQASYATGVVEIDPSNPNTVWLGTGENNAQRSVAFGDGVYRSVDGGKTWTNMGLKDSAHIGDVVIHPTDSDTVYVAAQGPLWNSGGERGLYKTSDGGKSWAQVLKIDEDTGANEIVMHAARPQELLVSTYQRRRHLWTLINGGPGSGIHKSYNGGESWTKITSGLPSVEMGRIGLAAAPSAPNVVYAIIEVEPLEGEAEKKGGSGVYRSDDFGESWTKMSGHKPSSPQYYNELVVDPHDEDRVYALDTFTHVSTDGGKTFKRLGLEHKHVDDHALWIDPDNPKHLRMGCDGGIYESYDYGVSWSHLDTLPVVQFYRIAADNDAPFYNVCGGTQDNNSLCGPSRTTYVEGITNEDWTIVLGGDGYEPQIDPTDANIIYAQYQYGGLARYDRTTGELVYIAPQPPSGATQYKWNWNSPLIISPHNSDRLYYGAERLFRSDDRGSSWTVVSPDLTQQLDRNRLKVMGRVWSVDAVAKNDSTSFWGSLIGIAESSLEEGLIYVSTDDGLIQVTEDGGKNWRKTASFADVPDRAYVEDVEASLHNANVAYAVIDNHKKGDHKPYVVRSADKGRTWSLISGDLPKRGSAHAIVEDHVDPDLLFVGTEFGLFFTQDQGEHWRPLNGGFPTVSVRDLEIQRRENDLLVGTFGRGIYVLDDLSPLRTRVAALESNEATLFPAKNTWLYVPRSRFGGGEKGSRGADYYQVDNPPHGAVLTYYLRDGLETLRKKRRDAERKRLEEGADNPYPSWEALRREDRENGPSVVLLVHDSEGQLVRRLEGPSTKGIHRVAWDLRYPSHEPVTLKPPEFRPPWWEPPQGPLVLPGTYTVKLAKRVDGKLIALGQSVSFEVQALPVDSPLVTDDRAGLLAFQNKTAELSRAVQGATKAMAELGSRIEHLKAAIDRTPAVSESFRERLRDLESLHDELNVLMSGDSTVKRRNEPAPWSISARVASIVEGHWNSLAAPTGTHREAYAIASEEFGRALRRIRRLDTYLKALEQQIEQNGAPWTPGRVPSWKGR
ncbi:MAG: glycosyl hydrolase [Myxococcota bacterium]